MKPIILQIPPSDRDHGTSHELGFFTSRIVRSEMECTALGFSYVVENLVIDNSLKWVPFNVVSGQITSNVLWKEGQVFFL